MTTLILIKRPFGTQRTLVPSLSYGLAFITAPPYPRNKGLRIRLVHNGKLLAERLDRSVGRSVRCGS